MTSFASLPIRVPAAVDVSWFNGLRSAGVTLENTVGLVINNTQFNLANNQVAAADVTGLLISPATYGSFEISYRIYRKTTGGGATELAETGRILGAYKAVAGTWEITVFNVGNAGITFTCTNAGQIQYTSTNITGSASASYIWFHASGFLL